MNLKNVYYFTCTCNDYKSNTYGCGGKSDDGAQGKM